MVETTISTTYLDFYMYLHVARGWSPLILSVVDWRGPILTYCQVRLAVPLHS